MKIRNISAGPRGIAVNGGIVMLEPGEERDLKPGSADLEIAKNSGWFNIGGEPETGPVPTDNPATTPPPVVPDRFDAMSDADLRNFIKERDGKAPAASTSREDLLAKARE